MPEKLDFITPTFMTVFEFFLEDPAQEHHEREVVRGAGVSKGSANKILRRLAEMDFLIRETKGRMVFYRLNAREPAVRQFKALANVYMLKGLVDRLKQHSKKILMFGSCARGVDVKGSDVDLFILSSEKALVKRIVSDFNQRSERKIAPIIVDSNELVQLRREDEPLYENIERGIVLWETE
jgi:predicted nucleotidyltransferase